MRARYRWELALVAICALWGYTFVIIKEALERMPPMLYLGLRFTIGAAALAAVGGARGVRLRELRAGLLIGGVLFAGYAFQQTGLQYTSASNAGFITGLFVVLTPVIGALALRAAPSRASILGVALATCGLVLLAMPAGFTLGKGDGMVLVTAVLFAVHILLLGRLARGMDALRIATVQIGVAGAAGLLASGAVERVWFDMTDGFLWFVLLLTGVGASALAFFVQTRAQQHIPPTRTAVILTAEPVFAGIAGYLLAGDRLGARGAAGAALIVAGILCAELLAPAREKV